MKRTIPRSVTSLRDTSSTTSEFEVTSQLPADTTSIPPSSTNTGTVTERAEPWNHDEFAPPARVQQILLQPALPSLPPITATRPSQADARNTPCGSHCNIPVYTVKGEKVQYFYSVKETVALRIDQWLEAVFHGLQAGRPLYLNPEEPERSGFIALTYNDVANTKSIQGVLADKCVILVDEPDSGFIFDRLSSSHFYPTKSKVIIRDHSHFPVERFIGTLNEVIEASSTCSGRLLSTERLPLHEGATTMSSIASDSATWCATKGLPLCPPDEVFPLPHLRGAYASTKGVLAELQIAHDGLGMVMNVECGALWVICAFPIQPETGFLLSTFGTTFSLDHPDPTKWIYEAVLLSPGMKLVIRPNTLYALIALEDTLYTVDNFYATSTLTDTLAGLVHAICSPHITKSVSTPSSCLLLQRYVICLHAAFVLDEIDKTDPLNDHLPDVLTPDGCSNFFAACVIGILLDIFAWSSYRHRHNHNGSSSNHEQDRYAHVRKLGYEALRWFFENHSVECEDPELDWSLPCQHPAIHHTSF
ncbi:hypothetical protein BJ165DRAFT_658932 [Panaeolus papilionaceus]|nr:hypothetical protein BJ165DRAFT_658932 [Panaeolus papilionaceus]